MRSSLSLSHNHTCAHPHTHSAMLWPSPTASTRSHLFLLVYVCDPLPGVGQEGVLLVQLHHGLVPGVQLVVAHVLGVNQAPLAPDNREAAGHGQLSTEKHMFGSFSGHPKTAFYKYPNKRKQRKTKLLQCC